MLFSPVRALNTLENIYSLSEAVPCMSSSFKSN